MIKRHSIGKCLLTALLTLLTLTASAQSGNGDRKFELTRNLDIFNALFKELDLYYVDTIQAEKIITDGINAMLSRLDPYTTYIPEKEREDFDTMTTGEYGGIGSIIQMRDNRVIISEPYEGMPAQEAGLLPGDVILAIDGESMLGKQVDQVSSKLRGEPGSKLIITLERAGEQEPIVKEVTRRKVLMNAVPYYGMLNDSIGYIYLSSFTDKAAREVRDALLELKKNTKLAGLVLDLRNNPGGILEDAIQIVNYFVPKGVEVLATKGKVKNWDRTYTTTQDPIDTDLPLAVLVSSGSASASEIVSGALQDLDRAVIIGERTFGKGLVQTTRPISYNGMVKVTTAKYYIPSGRCIQAIDYSNRNADGSVGRIPDSLTHVFTTAGGRLVRDGGGVTPDFQVPNSDVSNLLVALVRDLILFDYANQYYASHPEGIGDVHTFALSDSTYADFKRFVKSKEFTYDRRSDRVLQELRKIAAFEGYSDQASAEFDALEKKLTHNLDHDLDTFRPEIAQMLAQEIARRYYYQKGEIIQTLKRDDDLNKALEVLGNPELYRSTLSAPAQAQPAGKAKKK
jgi:carboxyl-terminal processing protease